MLFPGVYNYQVEEDISKLKLCVTSLLQEYNLNVSIKDDYIHELWVSPVTRPTYPVPAIL